MTNLVGLHYRQRIYTVRRYAACLKSAVSCRKDELVSIGITLIQPEAPLRVALLEGSSSVICTLTGGSTSETLTLTGFSAVYTSNRFSRLDTVICNRDSALSIYANEEVGFDLGQVTGAIYTDKRAIGTDEFGRITLVSTSVLVCLPGVDIFSGDVLIDQESNEHFSVIKAQQAFDRKGRLHHWELDVVQVRER